MMHNARIGKTPMVVYAGQSPSSVLFQEPHLSGPLVEMAKPIAKWSYQVEHAHDVPRVLRRAFKIAAEPPAGPVFLALPMDVLDRRPRSTSRRRPTSRGDAPRRSTACGRQPTCWPGRSARC